MNKSEKLSPEQVPMDIKKRMSKIVTDIEAGDLWEEDEVFHNYGECLTFEQAKKFITSINKKELPFICSIELNKRNSTPLITVRTATKDIDTGKCLWLGSEIYLGKELTKPYIIAELIRVSLFLFGHELIEQLKINNKFIFNPHDNPSRETIDEQELL